MMDADDVKIFYAIAFALILVGLGIWWEVSLWSECHIDHSFWYCARVLNK